MFYNLDIKSYIIKVGSSLEERLSSCLGLSYW